MVEGTIRHYRVLEKLGEGREGDAYLAEDTTLHRRVTLVFIDPTRRRYAEARERLVRRARAAAKLSHPNIAAVYAIEETPGHTFVVMERVTGDSLRALVGRGEMGIARALDIAAQILAALANAHETAVVHHHITSETIAVTGDGRVKVLGFGSTGTRGGDGAAATPSPEQVRGDPVDQRSDLFSFGVVLYEMLTGRMPFRGRDESALKRAIVHDEPAPLPPVRTGGRTDGLQAIVSRALAKDPKDRYQSAVEIAADLARVTAEADGP